MGMHNGRKDWPFDVEQLDIPPARRDVETGGRLLDMRVKWNTHSCKI
jgi:hypothetical protein